MISEKIEQYIERNIKPESPVLEELNRQTHLKVLNPRMLSGHLQGSILKMISNMIRPRHILEIGMYTGYSAICLAEGLQKNGTLHTIDINDELKEFAEEYFEKAGLKEKIMIHTGDAREIIPTLTESFDLVFIDAEKTEYIDYYNLVFDKVTPGGFILADNVLWSGKVAGTVNDNDLETQAIIGFNSYVNNDSRVENTILPVRDGLSIIRKK